MKMVQPADDVNPLVLGRLGRDPSKPTVTFYGHYDVQPAMEVGWRSDPFEVAAVDGYLYGRGTSDNKVCGCVSVLRVCVCMKGVYVCVCLKGFFVRSVCVHVCVFEGCACMGAYIQVNM